MDTQDAALDDCELAQPDWPHAFKLAVDAPPPTTTSSSARMRKLLRLYDTATVWFAMLTVIVHYLVESRIAAAPLLSIAVFPEPVIGVVLLWLVAQFMFTIGGSRACATFFLLCYAKIALSWTLASYAAAAALAQHASIAAHVNGTSSARV